MSSPQGSIIPQNNNIRYDNVNKQANSVLNRITNDKCSSIGEPASTGHKFKDAFECNQLKKKEFNLISKICNKRNGTVSGNRYNFTCVFEMN